MTENNYMEKIKEKVSDFVTEHPYITFQVTSSLVSYLAMKAYKAYSNLRSHNTVIELDLTNIEITTKPKPPLEQFMNFGEDIKFETLIQGILRASEDPKVVGLICKIGNSLHSLPTAYRSELRDTILKFKNSNKKTVCYSESLDLLSYYFASIFDKIYCIENSMLLIHGTMSISPFIKNTLKKLNISVDGYQREKFKNALNMFTEEKYTKEQKEITKELLDGFTTNIYEEISKGRKIEILKVKQWIDEGFFTLKNGIENGIIDGIGNKDEIYEKSILYFGINKITNASFLYLSKYIQMAGEYYSNNSKNTIAIIYLNGNIMSGENKDGIAGGDTISRSIRLAANDSKIKVIVFRVESRGGSATASSIIGESIQYAKKKGKKVIVSMGSIAASGGYWVSMFADKIFASKTTITGSIGVVSLKMNFRKMYSELLGITFDEISNSKSSEMFSQLHSIEKESHIDKKWNEFMDDFYDSFKNGVSKGRNLSLEKVNEIAQGKVYTGEQALKLGLIDEIGGFTEAIECAKEMIGLKKEDKVRLEIYPKQKSILEMFSKKKPKNSFESEKQGLAPSAGLFSFDVIRQSMKMLKVFNQVTEPVVNIIDHTGQQDDAILMATIPEL